jgi:hypothetical protein
MYFHKFNLAFLFSDNYKVSIASKIWLKSTPGVSVCNSVILTKMEIINIQLFSFQDMDKSFPRETQHKSFRNYVATGSSRTHHGKHY